MWLDWQKWWLSTDLKILRSITSYCGSGSSQRATPCGELSLLQLINVTLSSKAVGRLAFIPVSFGLTWQSPTDSCTQVTRSTLLLIPGLLNLANFYCLLVVQFSAFQEATSKGTSLFKRTGWDFCFHKILQHFPYFSYWVIRTKKLPVLQLL